MFLEVKLLILQREYSPQRGDVSAEGEQKAQLEKYSPQRGDVSIDNDRIRQLQEYSPQRGDVS